MQRRRGPVGGCPAEFLKLAGTARGNARSGLAAAVMFLEALGKPASLEAPSDRNLSKLWFQSITIKLCSRLTSDHHLTDIQIICQTDDVIGEAKLAVRWTGLGDAIHFGLLPTESDRARR